MSNPQLNNDVNGPPLDNYVDACRLHNKADVPPSSNIAWSHPLKNVIEIFPSDNNADASQLDNDVDALPLNNGTESFPFKNDIGVPSLHNGTESSPLDKSFDTPKLNNEAASIPLDKDVDAHRIDNCVNAHASCSYKHSKHCNLQDGSRGSTFVLAKQKARDRLNRVYRYKRDAGLTVASIVLILNIVTFVPVTFSVVSRFDPNPESLPKYRSVVITLALNSLINPFIYVFRLKCLRTSAYTALYTLSRRLRCL